MKRILSLLILFALLITIPVPTRAAEEFHELPKGYVYVEELDLTMWFPESFGVIMQTGPIPDVLKKAYGAEAEKLQARMKQEDMYLNAVNMDTNQELVVTMTQQPDIKDLNGKTEKEIEALYEGVEQEFKKMGFEVTSKKIYTHPQFPYMELQYCDKANNHYVWQNTFIHDHMAINSTYHSYNGPFTEEDELLIQLIHQYLNFNQLPYQITGEVNTFQFDLPPYWAVLECDWDEEAGTDSYEFFDLRTGSSIYYESTDIWEQTPPADRDGMKREEVDNSIFTDQDVAEIFGTPVSKVCRKKLGDNKYFVAEFEKTIREGELSEGSFSLAAEFVGAICVTNGQMHIVMVDARMDSDPCEDMFTLLKSAVYEVQENK